MIQDIGTIKSVLVRKFAHERARDFSDKAWLQNFFVTRDLYIAKIKIEIHVNNEQFKDTLVKFQPSQN